MNLCNENNRIMILYKIFFFTHFIIDFIYIDLNKLSFFIKFFIDVQSLSFV
jgi:hypothetical protein